MFRPRNIFLYGYFFMLAHVTNAEMAVQLNVNRPIKDVSDKFISFTIKPEDLYKALDSSNRKTITRMASMLSNSYVKFVGDYYFAAKDEGIHLRNPTKIVWKGFNKWTKAVNWSMIIPVPYNPDNWDPMETLKILNTSEMVDIDEAIWQLGTDFGTSRAADYVNELKTLNIMVDSFKHDTIEWQTIGADISAGSSPEETRRYVEMSKDMNAAYGWIQSDELLSGNSVASPLEGQDPALKVLFRSKVPVWLTLPNKKVSSLDVEDEVTDGLNWAQTMGEAANIGFDIIFKPMTSDDMEEAKYSFYATVLFKKIMGSRVYPARPLTIGNRGNKLYAHCANMVSGGLSLMLVNKQEEPLVVAVRSLSKIQDTEMWQFALTMNNGQIMLNNNKVNFNSTLTPEVRKKTIKPTLQLRAPARSVSFWVLPNANLDHCHFTEVQILAVPDNSSKKTKRYSSSDRLLKELIKETAKKPALSPLAGLLSRHRRSLDTDDRFRRFILEGNKDDIPPFSNLADNFVQELKNPLKRDIFTPDRRVAAIEWLSNIFKEPLNLDLPLLTRNVRQSDALNGPFFMTRDGKKTTFTKKITEIKKPEKKAKQVVSEEQEFDEDKFFKNVGEQPEPNYVRLPEGDVFLTQITSVDGNDGEEELNFETPKSKPKKETSYQPQEIISVMKPLRLLPTEFFEAIPAKPIPPVDLNTNFASALNPFLFSKPFGENLKQPEATKYMENEATHSDEEDVSKTLNNISQEKPQNKAVAEENDNGLNKDNQNVLNANEGNSLAPKNPPLSMANTDSFAYASNSETDKLADDTEDKYVQNDNEKRADTPWWDLSSKRFRRSLDAIASGDSWHENMITKEEDSLAAANEYTPTRLSRFENKVDDVVRKTSENSVGDVEEADGVAIGKKIVRTVKDQVTKFVDLFSHHANEWYTTFTKQFDTADDENTITEGNRLR